MFLHHRLQGESAPTYHHALVQAIPRCPTLCWQNESQTSASYVGQLSVVLEEKPLIHLYAQIESFDAVFLLALQIAEGNKHDRGTWHHPLEL